MDSFSILIISIAIQFTAAALALRLIPITGSRRSWVFISMAILLMAIRRCITLYRQISGETPHPPDLAEAWVTFVTSLLMLTGIGWIAPLFYSIRQTADELKTSEEKYRRLFEESRDAIYLSDIDERLIDVNHSALDLFGCTREQMIGMEINDIYVESEKSAQFREEMRRNESVKDFPAKLRRKDGTEMHCLITSTLRHNNNGIVVGWQGIIRDVSELRRLEEQFRQAQKMEAVGRLAGGVAHDFNNLLTAIMGYCDLLLQHLGTKDSNKRYADEIRNAAMRASDLTRQLLAFSRQQVLELRVMDLNEAVSNLHGMLTRLIGEDIRLETDLSPNLWPVKADPSQMEQVIMNLVVNARDAMPHGGELTIETQNVDLSRALVHKHDVIQPGPYVMLEVSDTGEGMDKKTINNIFEPFFTTKRQGKGTGLGLSTVYGIVKQSGGCICVFSEPQRGTSFKVYMPRANGDIDSLGRCALQPAAQQGIETILLVEDEDSVRAVICEVLQRKGYTVLEARHPSEALLICEQYKGPIHLLVTDVVMPGISGCELSESLTSLRPHARVLYISGYTENRISSRTNRGTGVAFLQKPFTPEVLEHKVREVLDGTACEICS